MLNCGTQFGLGVALLISGICASALAGDAQQTFDSLFPDTRRIISPATQPSPRPAS